MVSWLRAREGSPWLEVDRKNYARVLSFESSPLKMQDANVPRPSEGRVKGELLMQLAEQKSLYLIIIICEQCGAVLCL